MENILELKQQFIAAHQNGRAADNLYNEERAKLQKEINLMFDRFALENAALIQNVSETVVEMIKTENALRKALVLNYEETGVKTFDKDLSVRVTETIKYSITTALIWAKTNAPFLVQEVLDKKGFDPIAKAQNFDFVEIERKVSAVISKQMAVIGE